MNVNANVARTPLSLSLPEPEPAHALESRKSPSAALIILLCFLLGISAALGIAQQLGAFDSHSPKAGAP